MAKTRVLLPDPLMERLRRVAERSDETAGEIVHRAVERWVERYPQAQDEAPSALPVPTFRGGAIKTSAEAPTHPSAFGPRKPLFFANPNP